MKSSALADSTPPKLFNAQLTFGVAASKALSPFSRDGGICVHRGCPNTLTPCGTALEIFWTPPPVEKRASGPISKRFVAWQRPPPASSWEFEVTPSVPVVCNANHFITKESTYGKP